MSIRFNILLYRIYRFQLIIFGLRVYTGIHELIFKFLTRLFIYSLIIGPRLAHNLAFHRMYIRVTFEKVFLKL